MKGMNILQIALVIIVIISAGAETIVSLTRSDWAGFALFGGVTAIFCGLAKVAFKEYKQSN